MRLLFCRKTPRRQRGATTRRPSGGLRNARSKTTPAGRRMMLLVALCFLRRDHVWLLNALLIGGDAARPDAILQMHWSQVDFDAQEAAPSGKDAPVPQGNLVAAPPVKAR